MLLQDYCGVKAKDGKLIRLGSILCLAQESQIGQYEDFLLLKGLVPHTLQSHPLAS